MWALSIGIGLMFLSWNCYNAILTRTQWNHIETCLQHPGLTHDMKHTIERLLFAHYTPLVYRECQDFVSFHRFKTKLLDKSDLTHYGLIGLYHATRKYNGRSNFYKYARVYIRGSLYKGLTKHYPISKIPPKKRKESKSKKFDSYDNDDTDSWFDNVYLGNYEGQFSMASKETTAKTDYSREIELWNTIHNHQNPFVRRIMEEKFDVDFSKKRSNKEVAKMEGKSEEWVRRNVCQTIMNLTSSNIYEL